MFSFVEEKDKLRLSILLNIVLTVALIFIVFMYMNQYNDTVHALDENVILENKIESIKAEHQEELNLIDDRFNNIEIGTRDLKRECDRLSDMSLYTIETNRGLLVNIYDLEVANGLLMDKINDLSEKLSVYKKYDTYMYNVDRRTDCTYELLDYLETLVEDDILNNVDFYCAYINAESNWTNSYGKNDADRSGLANFKNSTNKWIYELVFENGSGSYSYDMIMDPYLSLKITKSYFYYLINLYDGDLYQALTTAKDDNLTDEYIAKLDYYLNQYNTSIEDIAKETKERYIARNRNNQSSSPLTVIKLLDKVEDIG